MPNNALSPEEVIRNSAVDGFGAARVSQRRTLFENQQQYGIGPLVWENTLTGAGAAVNHLPNESTVQLTTGATTSGNKVVRSSRMHHRYQPGKFQKVNLTGVLDGGAVTNVRRRIGYFNDGDGAYYELNGAAARFVLRTSTSGSPSDANLVEQASWNQDRLQGAGTGPSGLTLGVDKAYLLILGFGWQGTLGVGMGFKFSPLGPIVWCHVFPAANSLTLAYMKTANLPVRMELENTGTAGGVATMRHICSVVESEGGFETGFSYTTPIDTGAALVAVSSRRPVLALRANTVGPGGSIRNTAQALLDRIQVTAQTNDAYVEVVLNPATLTAGGGAPAWTAVDAANSALQVATNADAITGGQKIDSFFVPTGGTNSPSDTVEKYLRENPLVYTALGNVQDTVAFVVTPGTGTTNVHASALAREFY